MDGLFPNIFPGERSELREKYGLERIGARRGALVSGLSVASWFGS